jgi:hypothetical protein
MRNRRNKIKKGLLIGIQVSNNKRKKNYNDKKERLQRRYVEFHGDFFNCKV